MKIFGKICTKVKILGSNMFEDPSRSLMTFLKILIPILTDPECVFQSISTPGGLMEKWEVALEARGLPYKIDGVAIAHGKY